MATTEIQAWTERLEAFPDLPFPRATLIELLPDTLKALDDACRKLDRFMPLLRLAARGENTLSAKEAVAAIEAAGVPADPTLTAVLNTPTYKTPVILTSAMKRFVERSLGKSVTTEICRCLTPFASIEGKGPEKRTIILLLLAGAFVGVAISYLIGKARPRLAENFGDALKGILEDLSGLGPVVLSLLGLIIGYRTARGLASQTELALNCILRQKLPPELRHSYELGWDWGHTFGERSA